ncbi:hypothetical protein JD276_04115 [Leucobacter sp. CSA1]|uniref:Uncharacterized protein n=1 Tax=Leucobacter chromiisoli TaxID=2796471 RepID=A0A934Q4I7_9MICO|nr:hypothetical protein [Leucobacter chromiisoli]MBK0418214.1 hypothetical protein [Leucobacter chromiisoli]
MHLDVELFHDQGFLDVKLSRRSINATDVALGIAIGACGAPSGAGGVRLAALH